MLTQRRGSHKARQTLLGPSRRPALSEVGSLAPLNGSRNLLPRRHRFRYAFLVLAVVMYEPGKTGPRPIPTRLVDDAKGERRDLVAAFLLRFVGLSR